MHTQKYKNHSENNQGAQTLKYLILIGLSKIKSVQKSEVKKKMVNKVPY